MKRRDFIILLGGAATWPFAVWAQQSERQLGLYLSVRPPPADAGSASLGRFGLGALLEFNWQMAIGDEQLTLQEFESIASKKAPLVKLRGKWFSLDQQDTERALEFVRKQAGGKMSLLSALRLAGGAHSVEGQAAIRLTVLVRWAARPAR